VLLAVPCVLVEIVKYVYVCPYCSCRCFVSEINGRESRREAESRRIKED
jgi:hypothetical protein